MRTLLLILAFMPTVVFADRIMLADCSVEPGGEYFESGIHFAIGFNIDTSNEAIWMVNGDKLSWYAAGSSNTPFETNGGVWSMTMASDVRNSLRKLKFRFIDADFPPPISEISSQPPVCEMDYSQIEYYDSGDWLKDSENSKNAE